jgi:hypothetical protein
MHEYFAQHENAEYGRSEREAGRKPLKAECQTGVEVFSGANLSSQQTHGHGN